MSIARKASAVACHVAPGIEAIDWPAAWGDLDTQGWTILPKLLSANECDAIAGLYDRPDRFRSRVVMAQHGFGRG